METTTDRPALRRILQIDAASCAAMAAAFLAFGGPVGGLTGLSATVLTVSGALLVPVAALIAFAAARPSAALLRLIALGNGGWVAASLALILLASMNGVGVAFVLAQAAAVALFAAVEWRGAALFAAPREARP